LVLSLIILAPLGIGLWSVLAAGDALKNAVEDLGFNPIRLPNSLYTPGSILRVSVDGTVEDVICAVPNDVISKVGQISPAPSIVAQELTNSNFAFKAKIVERINSVLNGNFVQSVNFTLNDVKLLQVPANKLFDIATELLKEQSCLKQVKALVSAENFLACQASEVLQASVSYDIEYLTTVGGSGDVAMQQTDVIEAFDKVAPTAKITNVVESASASASSDGATATSRRITKRSGLLNYGMKIYPVCITFEDGPKIELPSNLLERVLARLERLVS
jgi:hypothetical protein